MHIYFWQQLQYYEKSSCFFLSVYICSSGISASDVDLWWPRSVQLSSKPASASIAYSSLVRRMFWSLNSGSFSRFIQVLDVGKRSCSFPALWMQNAGYKSCNTHKFILSNFIQNTQYKPCTIICQTAECKVQMLQQEYYLYETLKVPWCKFINFYTL